jgi:hypothetical protein
LIKKGFVSVTKWCISSTYNAQGGKGRKWEKVGPRDVFWGDIPEGDTERI